MTASEPRIWTDLREPPVSSWWTQDDSWHLLDLAWTAAVRFVCHAVARIVGSQR